MSSVTVAPDAVGSTWTPKSAHDVHVVVPVCCTVKPSTVTSAALICTASMLVDGAGATAITDSATRLPVAGVPALAPRRVTGWVMWTAPE